MLSKIVKKISILIFLMTLFLFATTEISSNAYAESNPLIGKWGYIVLEHHFPNSWCTWKTESGTLTFNSDGTAVATYAESADNCPDEHCCKPTETTYHTYTINPDGTFTFYTKGGHGNGVLSNDGKMLIMDSTASPDSQVLVVAVRLDTTKQYNNSDLSGDYYMIGYERDNLDGRKGYNRAWSTIISMDGAGNYLMNGKLNGDGSIITVTNDSGIYSVHSDGSIAINNVITGHALGDGKVAVFSNPSTFYPQTADDFAGDFAMKKQDRNYSTSDLSGRWAYTAFGDTSGSVRSEFGTINCNSSGACQLSANVLNADGEITDKQKSITISIQPDGSYNGFFLSGAMPHISGALGNDGNTMFLVMNEDNTSTNDRLTGVAIRTSGPPSCPSLYFWNGNDYERRGFIFPGAFYPKYKYVDNIFLNQLVPNRGQYGSLEYSLQIREEEVENSLIDMAKLIMVDHGSDVSISDFFMKRDSISAPHTQTSEIWYNNNFALASLKQSVNSMELYPTGALKVKSPISAGSFSTVEDVTYQVFSSDGQYVSLDTGDRIILTFPYFPQVEGQIRDFIFVVEGFYVALDPPPEKHKELCSNWARIAVDQNEENLRRACGFTGPQWNSDYNNHFQFCLSVPWESAISAGNDREDDLRNRCRGY